MTFDAPSRTLTWRPSTSGSGVRVACRWRSNGMARGRFSRLDCRVLRLLKATRFGLRASRVISCSRTGSLRRQNSALMSPARDLPLLGFPKCMTGPHHWPAVLTATRVPLHRHQLVLVRPPLTRPVGRVTLAGSWWRLWGSDEHHSCSHRLQVATPAALATHAVSHDSGGSVQFGPRGFVAPRCQSWGL